MNESNLVGIQFLKRISQLPRQIEECHFIIRQSVILLPTTTTTALDATKLIHTRRYRDIHGNIGIDGRSQPLDEQSIVNTLPVFAAAHVSHEGRGRFGDGEAFSRVCFCPFEFGTELFGCVLLI